MRQQWSQNAKKLTNVDGHEIAINEFIEIMLRSGQFNSKQEAQNYFDLLDIDQNGAISFTEFFAPIVPHLTKEEVLEFTRGAGSDGKKGQQYEWYTIEDLTKLRLVFQETLEKAKQKNKEEIEELKIS